MPPDGQTHHATDAAGTAWQPDQYARFAGPRERPALDLFARIDQAGLADPREVVDLGCGTGALARRLAARFPEARVTGVDHSSEMIERARAQGGGVQYVLGDLAAYEPDRPADVLVSNAALHWVPDHETLLPRLLGRLAPGGLLAVQVPLSHGQPSHVLMREVLAQGGPGGAPLGTEALRTALARPWVLSPARVHALLAEHAAEVELWTTEYLHVLTGPEPVYEWVRGTGLRPILAGLEPDELDGFLAEYRRRLLEAYPTDARGHTLFPFRRLFFLARARASPRSE